MFSQGAKKAGEDPLKFLQELPNNLPKVELPTHLPSLSDIAQGSFSSHRSTNSTTGTGEAEQPRAKTDKLTLAWAIADGWNGRAWEKRWSELKRPDKPKVLILMSETGGGHKASARSIAEALEELAPDQISVNIVDVFVEHAGFPFNKFPKMYQFFSSKPTMWDAVYKTSKITSNSILGWEEPLALAWDADFQKCVHQYNPDIIVSVHPLCQDPTCRVVRRIAKWKAGRKVPFVTCVTDLGEGHPFWFHPEVDRCFVPGEAVKKNGLESGLTQERLAMLGLPVRKGFWGVDTSLENKQAIRSKLGLKDWRTVLVVGGGDGMGDLLNVALAVGKAIPSDSESRQVVVVCGKNEEVKNKLDKQTWDPRVSVVVLGFVNNMDEWMVSADILVTKAGPGTIAEATVVGLPIMLSGFLPGQEEANVTYVVDGHMGEYRNDPKELGVRVCSWLDDPSLVEMMASNSKKAGRPHASLDIAKDILDVMAEHARPAEDLSAASEGPVEETK